MKFIRPLSMFVVLSDGMRKMIEASTISAGPENALPEVSFPIREIVNSTGDSNEGGHPRGELLLMRGIRNSLEKRITGMDRSRTLVPLEPVRSACGST